jgi:hypothetical protein
MKLFFYVAILSLVIGLSACGGLAELVGPTCDITVEADKFEPNDKPEDATLLTTDEITGTFKELDLPDYFTVNGAAGDVVLLEQKAGLGKPTLNVKDAEGNALSVQQGVIGQTVTLPKSGTYLIQVGMTTTGNECPDDVMYDLSVTPGN